MRQRPWSCVLRYTYTNEDDEETTPFRELVQHMPGNINSSNGIELYIILLFPNNNIIIIIDVAEIVLNKCMEITGPAHEPAVKFNYDYVDDFAEPEKHSNSAGMATPLIF